MSSDVSVVVVNHRSAGDVVRALGALASAEPGIACETIVVDNASGDADLAVLARIAGTRLVASAENEGFGRACNRAAALASGEWLLLLNPDVEPRPGAVTRLLAEAREHPEAAVVAPRLLNLDGSEQRNARAFYRWQSVLARRAPLGRLLAGRGEEGRHLLAGLDPCRSHEVDWVTGACLLLRREDFAALGGFDPRFFLYFEDVDLCLRAWRAGRTVRFVPAAIMVHAQRRASRGWRLSRPKREHLRSMLAFRRKWGGWPGRDAPRRNRARCPLVFLNQGRGALAERARLFAGALGGRVLAKDAIPAGPVRQVLAAALEVLRERPCHLHVLDVGWAGVVVEAAARLVGAGVVLDTGDEYLELKRRTGVSQGLGLEVAALVERLALGLAQGIVARGRGHVASLRERGYTDLHWIPDGVEVDLYACAAAHPWRAERGWERFLVVASVGSLLVDERYRVTQGWDLVEALALAPGVRGVVVGDGPGRALLEQRAHALGVGERLAFLGRVDPAELPSLLKSFDICISTQTDDPVGRARTTGKLPLFLAAGRFVLATDVGEAARLLPAEMLLRFRGEHDPAYPLRLARRLCELDADRARLERGAELVALARLHFEYAELAARAAALAAGGGDTGKGSGR